MIPTVPVRDRTDNDERGEIKAEILLSVKGGTFWWLDRIELLVAT